jgi:hypothetical protein
VFSRSNTIRGRKDTPASCNEAYLKVLHRDIISQDKKAGMEPIAWLIPVTGRWHRAPLVCAILSSLLKQGVSPQSIFVCDDKGGRNKFGEEALPPGASFFDGVFSSDIDMTRNLAKAAGVNFIFTDVTRDRDENPTNEFGLFLARHYKQAYDYLFCDDPDCRSRLTPGLPPLVRPAFSYVALIEDDLQLAPDAARFFTSCSDVMSVDPSVGVCCAWNSLSFPANR